MNKLESPTLTEAALNTSGAPLVATESAADVEPGSGSAATISSTQRIASQEDSGRSNETQAPHAAHRGDIKALTALRFFGVFWVVIDHAQGAFGWLARAWEGVALCQAVTFFFVLSGFVLTYNYYNLHEPKKIISFYIGRWARLWPIHMIGIALLIGLMPGIFKPTKDLMPMFIANVALMQSAIPILKYFYSYNAPSWSASTLIILYTAFPALLMLLRRSWLALAAVTIGGIVGSIGLANYLNVPEADPLAISSLGLLYVSPVSRLVDFAVGMFAAVAYRNYLRFKQVGVVPGTMLEIGTLVVVSYIAANSFKWRYACMDWAGPHASYWLQNCGFALVGCLLLVAVFSVEAGLLSKAFRHKVWFFLGEISFCMYVLHTVFLVYGKQVLHMDESPATFIAYIAILMVSAYVMYRFVEQPSRNFARNFTRKHIYRSETLSKGEG
ncbi:acyltransferase [Candidatus Obscuribacterales bacterium]|nr:acyltransferase [Candidatus Obscuribacterales bacterium]